MQPTSPQTSDITTKKSSTRSTPATIVKGPGPLDPNLPPVIDISQATVLFSINDPNNNGFQGQTSQPQQNTQPSPQINTN